MVQYKKILKEHIQMKGNVESNVFVTFSSDAELYDEVMNYAEVAFTK